MTAESLRVALDQEPDVEVVGAQLDAGLLEERVLQSDADVLLLDAALDAARIKAVVQQLSASVRVIIVGHEHDSPLLVPCVEAGAIGYLTGRYALAELVSAIRRAHDGWVVFTPEQITTLVTHAESRAVDPSAAERCASLSARERDVLRVLAGGATVDQTAVLLLISGHTVQSHLKNAMRKLNVSSRLAAVVLALRAGALDEPSR
jgi:DNA-binding NarL/FixJ family response regulator